MKYSLFSISSLLLVSFLLSCAKKESLNEKDLESTFSSKQILSNVILPDSIFNNQLITTGKVNSVSKSNIRPKSNNEIIKINVSNGQKVDKGHVLAVLENQILENQLNKSKIELNKSIEKIEELKINQGLSDKVSKSKLRKLEIQSGLLIAKNQLKKAQLEYNQSILKAPFTGTIANIEKKKGDFITTSNIFCTVVDNNNFEVNFSILESELNFVSIQQKITFKPFSTINKEYGGEITEINPVVNKNGLIRIKAKVFSKNNPLFDGMNVKVYINNPLKNVVVIPKKALILRSNKEVVFSLEKGLAKWNYVEIVGENTKSYAIKKGLNLNDTIITSGNSNLTHGSKVNANFIFKDTILK